LIDTPRTALIQSKFNASAVTSQRSSNRLRIQSTDAALQKM
jgi:hypothetical protein